MRRRRRLSNDQLDSGVPRTCLRLTAGNNGHEEKHASQITKVRYHPISEDIDNTYSAVEECGGHELKILSPRRLTCKAWVLYHDIARE